MYWEEQSFGIPSARNKRKWKVAFSTSPNQKSEEVGRTFNVPGRSITVLIAKPE